MNLSDDDRFFFKGIRGQLDRGATNGLAEEIIREHRTGHRFARQVIGLVRRNLNFEFGQDVIFDFNRALGARGAGNRANLVATKV